MNFRLIKEIYKVTVWVLGGPKGSILHQNDRATFSLFHQGFSNKRFRLLSCYYSTSIGGRVR